MISKQSVEGAAWFLLLLIVKCKRKEVAVMRLEAEAFQQPQKPGRGQKAASLRAFREHGSARILSLNSQNWEIINVFLLSSIVKLQIAQSYPTLWECMDYTVHGIHHARILEWVAFPFSRGSSQPQDRTQVSRIAGRFFTR